MPLGMCAGYLLIGGFIESGIYYVPILIVGILTCLLAIPLYMVPEKLAQTSEPSSGAVAPVSETGECDMCDMS